MNRPYIFCHMMTSVDGKIWGDYMDMDETVPASDAFYNIAFGKDPYYHHQGWLSGRVTTDDNFTFYEKPEIIENSPLVPEGDFVADDSFGMYYVSVDPSGHLGWKSSRLKYVSTEAHVIEVLSAKASNDYKAFLRRLGVSYIIAGDDRIDFEVAMDKLYSLFHIETLMLGGGAILNWSFIQTGMCDELSVVIAPAADASPETPALFSSKGFTQQSHPVAFVLKDVRALPGDAIWIRYGVKSRE